MLTTVEIPEGLELIGFQGMLSNSGELKGLGFIFWAPYPKEEALL